MKQLYGDNPFPYINASWILPGTPEHNLFSWDEDIQYDMLKLTGDLCDIAGLGRLETIGSYTLDSKTVKIASAVGIHSINSQCVWQNVSDGGWLINHWGAPIEPYFASKTDFRKVDDSSDVILSPMGIASSIRNYSFYMFDEIPTNSYAVMRYSEKPAHHPSIHRFINAFDGYIADASYQKTPFFITIGIENFFGDAIGKWQMSFA